VGDGRYKVPLVLWTPYVTIIAIFAFANFILFSAGAGKTILAYVCFSSQISDNLIDGIKVNNYPKHIN
jgi:hypothetical protein